MNNTLSPAELSRLLSLIRTPTAYEERAIDAAVDAILDQWREEDEQDGERWDGCE